MSYYRRKYDSKQYPKLVISPVSVLSVIIGILISFVIPAQIIELYREGEFNPPVYSEVNSNQNNGNVAGASTSRDIESSISGALNNDEMLMIGGSAILIIGVLFCAFIIFSDTKETEEQSS